MEEIKIETYCKNCKYYSDGSGWRDVCYAPTGKILVSSISGPYPELILHKPSRYEDLPNALPGPCQYYKRSKWKPFTTGDGELPLKEKIILLYHKIMTGSYGK